MMDFDFEIQYKKGIEMPADFLSRSTIDKFAQSILLMKTFQLFNFNALKQNQLLNIFFTNHLNHQLEQLQKPNLVF